jgi:hypothetical protein
VRRALWPEGSDLPEPEVDFPAEETITAAFFGPEDALTNNADNGFAAARSATFHGYH